MTNQIAQICMLEILLEVMKQVVAGEDFQVYAVVISSELVMWGDENREPFYHLLWT